MLVAGLVALKRYRQTVDTTDLLFRRAPERVLADLSRSAAESLSRALLETMVLKQLPPLMEGPLMHVTHELMVAKPREES